MKRSVLPARRKAAKTASKEKAAAQRRQRRKANLADTDYVEDPETYEDDAESNDDSELRSGLSEVVRIRRGADKLAPLFRWARDRVKNLPRRDRLSHMKSVLPPGTIGDHAVGHLAQLDEFENPEDLTYNWDRAKYKAMEHDRDLVRRKFKNTLKDAIDEGFHKDVNILAKACALSPLTRAEDFAAWFDDNWNRRKWPDPVIALTLEGRALQEVANTVRLDFLPPV